MNIALVHDYLTQRGGAERVVLSLRRAFPEAPLHTSLYDPERTFDEFGHADVRTLWINSIPGLRRRHRLALPLLAIAFTRLRVDADVVVCSSSGWAHGAKTTGRKIVYCHAPARWLYQSSRYLGRGSQAVVAGAGLAALRPFLRSWDRGAAATADRYLVNSTAVRDQVRRIYGIEAEVIPPPHSIDPLGPRDQVAGVAPGFALLVSRLLPYKNVDAVITAFAGLPAERLVVVGEGPDEPRLRSIAPRNVSFAGTVSDAQLRWLYAECWALVAASFEDFGLTPLEAGSFGKPCAVLRFGGFLDTVVEGETGLFFDQPHPTGIRDTLKILRRDGLDGPAIARHAGRFSQGSFIERIREIVRDELGAPHTSAAEQRLRR